MKMKTLLRRDSGTKRLRGQDMWSKGDMDKELRFLCRGA